MKYRVIVLPLAKMDIESDARWWAVHHSVDQATRWFDTMELQIGSLTQFPESHPLSAENDKFPYEIRDKFLGIGTRPSHRAVFTIRENTVYVLTVQHVSQDVLSPEDISHPPAT